MKKGLAAIFITALMIMPLAIFGCKARVEKEEAPNAEMTEASVSTEEVIVAQAPLTEFAPAQTLGRETIPPTAAVPSAAAGPTAIPTDILARNKEIQTALKAAKFYTGNIDGRIGPKTKRAITEFQKAKGLKVDGKVGPKTWAELEKYLGRQ